MAKIILTDVEIDGEQRDFVYNSSTGRKKEEKFSKSWIFFVKLKVTIAIHFGNITRLVDSK